MDNIKSSKQGKNLRLYLFIRLYRCVKIAKPLAVKYANGQITYNYRDVLILATVAVALCVVENVQGKPIVVQIKLLFNKWSLKKL